MAPCLAAATTRVMRVALQRVVSLTTAFGSSHDQGHMRHHEIGLAPGHDPGGTHCTMVSRPTNPQPSGGVYLSQHHHWLSRWTLLLSAAS